MSHSILLNMLRAWRDETARKQGVESYRIFPNATLEAIALAQPGTLEELKTIKGIKEVKSRLYGKSVIELVQKSLGQRRSPQEDDRIEEQVTPLEDQNETLTISRFLDTLNLELSGMAARIIGEVTSVDIRERVVYFSLKDKEDESVLSCLMFRSRYDIAGVKLSIGDEVVAEGVPDIYKPSGRLSFRVESIEYAGEGRLKKAYDELFQRLEAEGIFARENKRLLPLFPERIALITSKEGAALGDFKMNLTRAGMHITLFPTLVEGKRAVFEIMQAIEYFNTKSDQYDVLVIVRGGGSLESLQAFNTEALVRAIRTSTIPVLAGIGHERDVSLAALAADSMVSTPTATARQLSVHWDEARQCMKREELFLKTATEKILIGVYDRINSLEGILEASLEIVFQRVQNTMRQFQEKIILIPEYCRNMERNLDRFPSTWKIAGEGIVRQWWGSLDIQAARLAQYDPMRALKLGYSLVRRHNGGVIRTIEGVAVGDTLHIQLGNGRLESEVKRVLPH